MASQIKKDESPTSIGTETSNISYAGVLLNKAEGNIESIKKQKDIKETPVKNPKEIKGAPVKIQKEIKNIPKAPSMKQAVPATKVKNTSAPPVQEKENIGTPSNISTLEEKQETGEKDNKGVEEIDDDDFCTVTTRKSKEKRNNADKHSLVHDRHSRMKKMRRSDSLSNENWRNHKPVVINEDKETNGDNKEVNKEDLKFVEAPIPKVNPWTSNKVAAAALVKKVAQTEKVEKKVLSPKQPETVTKIKDPEAVTSGEFLFNNYSTYLYLIMLIKLW